MGGLNMWKILLPIGGFGLGVWLSTFYRMPLWATVALIALGTGLWAWAVYRERREDGGD
jgi:hypothetical protein